MNVFPLYTVPSQSTQPIRTVGRRKKKSNSLFKMIIYIDNIFICFDLINVYATYKMKGSRTNGSFYKRRLGDLSILFQKGTKTYPRRSLVEL